MKNLIILVSLFFISTNEVISKGMNEIYLAGGCFWGTEHFIRQINGVISTEVGYANGTVVNPTYEQVCSGSTNHAETVKVVYDSSVVSLGEILELFYMTINPTSLNQQGGDIGTQYRTGIYYTKSDVIPTIEKSIEILSLDHLKPIVIEVLPLINFYSAENHHQDYLVKNEGGYCHINPKLFEFAKNANKKKE